VQLGLPCLTVSHDDVDRLMAAVEGDPALTLEVDVVGLSVRAGDLQVAATMPAAAHDALVTGLWDGTGLLLADFDQVRALADTLPYVTGRW
jgi:3-isopropylmalate/(R)-2-methylmalate dehydratase small subunit